MSWRPSCSPRHRRWCSPAHAQLVAEYRDQRDARDWLRESDVAAPASYSYGANVSVHQLEDHEFAEAYPVVTFRDWLVANAGRNRQPDDVAWAS